VLEEVREAGDARALVDRADARDPAGRDVGVALARHHQHAQAVFEGHFLHRHLLRERGGRRPQEEHEETQSGSFHNP
jgi:hypothetical protein